jgi:hypothetical protein
MLIASFLSTKSLFQHVSHSFYSSRIRRLRRMKQCNDSVESFELLYDVVLWTCIMTVTVPCQPRDMTKRGRILAFTCWVVLIWKRSIRIVRCSQDNRLIVLLRWEEHWLFNYEFMTRSKRHANESDFDQSLSFSLRSRRSNLFMYGDEHDRKINRMRLMSSSENHTMCEINDKRARSMRI